MLNIKIVLDFIIVNFLLVSPCVLGLLEDMAKDFF